MRDDDLDRALSVEQDIVPSSGFVASVMSSIADEAAAPPPIPFPWSRLWPGLVAAAVALLSVPAVVLLQLRTAGAPAPAVHLTALEDLVRGSLDWNLHWLALALVLTYLAIDLPRRLLIRR